MNSRLYRTVLGACFLSIVLSGAYFGHVLPTAGSVVYWMGTQCCVYSVIVAYARTCRQHAATLAVVLTMTVAAMAITVLIARGLTPPIGYGLIIWIIPMLALQTMIAIFGCYLGYAVVECRHLWQYRTARAKNYSSP